MEGHAAGDWRRTPRVVLEWLAGCTRREEGHGEACCGATLLLWYAWRRMLNYCMSVLS
jgi:Fe-S oxidoreductase